MFKCRESIFIKAIERHRIKRATLNEEVLHVPDMYKHDVEFDMVAEDNCIRRIEKLKDRKRWWN